MEPYYYNHLNKQQQSAYYAMKTGLQSLSSSFPVPMLEPKELTDLYFLLRLDCPEIFYTVSFKYRYAPGASTIELLPEYLFDKNKIRDHQKALKSRIDKLARPAAGLSEMEKLLYIHDFICQNVRYDKLKKAYSHEIIGPLTQGVGVCEGIAKSVKALCDVLGIWCIIPISDNNPEKKIKYRHTWNIVRINGKFYHLDVTFDNSLGKPDQVRYDYMMLSDKQIFRDHEPIIWKVPVCEDGDHFYYKEKKMSFTKLDDVQKRASQAVKKGKTLTFHWRGGYLTKEVLGELFDLIGEEAKKKEKYARVSLNWSQAVLQVRFETELPETQFEMEEVNEGEKEELPLAAEKEES